MKLLTKELKKKMPKLYSTEDVPLGDKVVQLKLFTPDSNFTWYVVEGEGVEMDDYLMWGLVDGHEREFGYISLKELESVRGPFGLPIERDMYFTPKPLRDVPELQDYIKTMEG